MKRLNPKRIFLVLITLIAFMLTDHTAAYLADQIILNRDADFERRFDFDRLDWSKGYNRDCEIRRIFILYRYQTCFVSVLGETTFPNSQTRYYYHKPIALTHPSRVFLSMEYYFNENALARAMRTIKKDGTIEELGNG